MKIPVDQKFSAVFHARYTPRDNPVTEAETAEALEHTLQGSRAAALTTSSIRKLLA
jgi:hypothetical protein